MLQKKVLSVKKKKGKLLEKFKSRYAASLLFSLAIDSEMTGESKDV